MSYQRQKNMKGTSDASAGEASSLALAVAEIPPKVNEVINRTIPTGPKQRFDRLWEFARRLKGISGLDTSPTALLGYVREWHRRALPFIETKQFEATERDFFNSWKNARTPLTDGGLASQLRPALAGPDPDWLQRELLPWQAKKLLRVCAILQKWTGDKPFFLSAKVAASVIGTDQMDTRRLFKKLVKTGYLRMVVKGSRETGKPTTWRFKGPQM